MEFSVAARVGILVIHWCHARHHRKSVTPTATVTRKEYFVPTSVDKLKTVHVAKPVHGVDVERSVIRDRVQLDSSVRMEHVWQVASVARIVRENARALTRNVWIRVLEVRLAGKTLSVRWPTIKHSAFVRMDSKEIHGKVVCNTNVKRTKIAN